MRYKESTPDRPKRNFYMANLGDSLKAYVKQNNSKGHAYNN